MTEILTQADDHTGRAYGRPAPHPDEDLVRCGPGTLGGELLRRYWQPVAMSRDTGELPQMVKLLDEGLVLYRDKSGVAGLLYPRCMHRGTSLLFGKVEENGLRCCYHGWLFDAQGHCLEMPCEPDNPGRTQIRQPWYPVVERFGIIFTYMGPPERQPPFPHFSLEDDLGEDEELVSYWRDTGPNGGGLFGTPPKLAAWSDYNWWQAYDNFMDAFHVAVLHTTINGQQFEASMGVMPQVKFVATPDGVKSVQHRPLPDGRVHQRVSQVILPNMNCTAGVSDDDLTQSGLGWTVPIDDTHHRNFGVSRVKKLRNTGGSGGAEIGLMRDDWGPKGKLMRDWSLEDHQRWQNDYTAQKGQGDISFHSEEHLTRIDRGASMMRKLFKQQARAVAEGRDPIGAGADGVRRVEVCGGNAILDGESLKRVAGFDGR
jgi:phenylpropionate dioxygenase-like ring-hydroxylating dioxygenase large terminal subunit